MVAIAPALLRHEITVERRDGVTGVGAPAYGSAATYRARVEPSRRRLRRPDGSVVVAAATAWVAPGVPVQPEDRVVVDGQTYEVAERLDHFYLYGVWMVELVLVDVREGAG